MKITKFGTIGLFVIMFLFTGCATDVANRYYGTQHYPPKKSKDVELLWHKPSLDFDVIADFQSRGESPEDMRRHAAKIGADAVIVSTLGGYYERGEEWAGHDSQSNSYSRITGTAIKYK